ncbi:MAG: entericidin A/B family lipoprotein [Desulforhopalus sp.]
MRTLSLLFLLLLSVGTLTSCNTMSGIGQDVEAAGDAIEDTAEDKKSY